LIYGGSDYFRLEKPLNCGTGQVLTSSLVSRRFGNLNTHWVAATVDPRDPNLCEFSPRIVPVNVKGRRDTPPSGAASVGGPAGLCLFVYRPKRFFRKAAWSAWAAVSTVLCVAPA